MAYTVILTDILYQTVTLYCSFSIKLNTDKTAFLSVNNWTCKFETLILDNIWVCVILNTYTYNRLVAVFNSSHTHIF